MKKKEIKRQLIKTARERERERQRADKLKDRII